MPAHIIVILQKQHASRLGLARLQTLYGNAALGGCSQPSTRETPILCQDCEITVAVKYVKVVVTGAESKSIV